MKLDKYLIKHNLTLEAFAKKVGATISAVSRWQNGNRLPRPGMIRKIAKVTKGRITIMDWYD